MNDLTLTIYGVPVTLPEAEWSRVVTRSVGSGCSFGVREVLEIRRAYHERSVPTSALAARFGVSRRTIFRVLSGDTYGFLPHPASARGHATIDHDVAVFLDSEACRG